MHFLYNDHVFFVSVMSWRWFPDVETVLELIDMLQEKAYPAAQRELKELTDFAQSKGFNGQLQLWDIPFWSERLRENMYQYEEEELRSFFPLPTVLNGMFTLANRLFGITIEAADGQAQVWHPDVRFFNIKVCGKIRTATIITHILR